MKPFAPHALIALLSCALPAWSVAQNLLTNPGFEQPITFDGPPFVGSWEGFNGGSGSSAANSTTAPRSGAQSLQLTISNTNNTFAGAFQDVLVTAGTEYVFSGWNLMTTNPFDVTPEVRIEWRNSGTNTEVSRTPNLSPPPSGTYAPFSLTAVAPAGADTARVLYSIQTFGPEPTNNGTVFVDDLSFTVPEPATWTLIGAGLCTLIGVQRVRRRKTLVL